MAEKSYGKSRVQGGWAKSNTSRDGPQKSNKTIQSINNQSCQKNSIDRFEFKSVKLSREPTHREINSSDEYLISNEPNGPSRLILRTDFIDLNNSEWIFKQLYDEIQWQQHKVRKGQNSYLQPRMLAWFGNVTYSYSGITHNRSTEWSPLMLMLKDTIEGQMGRSYNSMLATLYRDGHDHIPWHSDDEPELGTEPSIASLSFGETRMFEMRRKPYGEYLDSSTGEPKDTDYLEYIKIPLKTGTLVLMEGATQLDWQHRIPREYHDRKPRINLTFRFIKK